MVNVSVTVDREHLPVIGDVAEALRARGMQVEQVLRLGFITGSVPDDRRATLDAVDGVESVDEEQPVRLPPAEDDLQ
ncbi:MAG: uncharacterized protein JWO49_1222 [Arthrobacter sp.]|nr:uncharacterized protein [Arthrobacter sp.]MCU1548634.1 uncharacterized protein [Arthrobacter sp.]